MQSVILVFNNYCVMNNQELARYLDKLGVHYVVSDDALIITNLNEDLEFKMLFTLSGKVIFENDGYIKLHHLKIVTGNLTFYNRGNVYLKLLEASHRIVLENEDLAS